MPNPEVLMNPSQRPPLIWGEDVRVNHSIERLKQVIRVLEELPPEKNFNMEDWCECRTVACAVGWSAEDPWFQNRGLHLVKNTDPLYPKASKIYFPVLSDRRTHIKYTGWYAVCRFFGDRVRARHIFDAHSYSIDDSKIKRKDVIKRIREEIAILEGAAS